MPVEIKELVIRAVVTQQPDDEFAGALWRKVRSPTRQTIVDECVRQVLKILKKSKER